MNGKTTPNPKAATTATTNITQTWASKRYFPKPISRTIFSTRNRWMVICLSVSLRDEHESAHTRAGYLPEYAGALVVAPHQRLCDLRGDPFALQPPLEALDRPARAPLDLHVRQDNPQHQDRHRQYDDRGNLDRIFLVVIAHPLTPRSVVLLVPLHLGRCLQPA